MQKEILLIGKKIITDKSPVVFSYEPDENWREYFDAKLGTWTCENGYLIGKEPKNAPCSH